jgi:hypothetical protein
MCSAAILATISDRNYPAYPMPKRINISEILSEFDTRKQTKLSEFIFPTKAFRLISSKEVKSDDGKRWVDFTMNRVMKLADQDNAKELGLLVCGLGTGFDGYYKPNEISFVDKRPEIRLEIAVPTKIKNFDPIKVQEFDYFKGELYDVSVEPTIYLNEEISVPSIKSVPAATRLRFQHYHCEGSKLMDRLLDEGKKNPAWAIAVEQTSDLKFFETNLNIELQNHSQHIANECLVLFADYSLAQDQTNSALLDIALSLQDGTSYRRISLMPRSSEIIARFHGLLSDEVFAQPKNAEEPEEVEAFQSQSDKNTGTTSPEELPTNAEINPKRRGKTRKVSEDVA